MFRTMSVCVSTFARQSERVRWCLLNSSLAAALLVLSSVAFAGDSCEPTFISDDRFEVSFSDNLAEFRVDSLVLEHPHFIFDFELGSLEVCGDATNQPLEILGNEVFDGVNPELAARIDDLEFNFLQQLNPFGQTDLFDNCLVLSEGECDSPSSCVTDLDDRLMQAPAQIRRTGVCVEALDGLFEGTWPDGESSTPNLPESGEAGCVVSEPVDTIFSLSTDDFDLDLGLKDVIIAGRFDQEEPTALVDGVMVGFLNQELADDTEIVLETDLGDVTLNLGHDILPSGDSGDPLPECGLRDHCDGPDARVVHKGECGWWFVFNIHAERIR